MLSIVWKTLDGSEHLYGGVISVSNDAGGSIKCQIPGSVITIDSGTVYAMNENGKTIATYHISGKKVHGPNPQHKDAPTVYPDAPEWRPIHWDSWPKA
jgi:hypothetical protein